MKHPRIYIFILLASATLPLSAQQPINLESAVKKALADYPTLKAQRLNETRAEWMQKTVSPLGDFELSGGGEEMGQGNDAVYTLARARQNIDLFLTAARRGLYRQQTHVSQAETKVTERQLARQVSLDYVADYTSRLRWANLLSLDSLYADFEQVARQRYEVQAISLLEYQTAVSRRQQIKLALDEAVKDLETAHRNLSRWLSADTLYMATDADVTLPSTLTADSLSHPLMLLARERSLLAEADIRDTKAQLRPRLFVEGGVQKIGSSYGYYAWQVGLSFPLAFSASRAKVKASETESRRIAAENEAVLRTLTTERQKLTALYAKYKQSTDYYEQTALPLARQQQRMAALSYRSGSIGYLDFIQTLTDAMTTRQGYVETLGRLLETKYQLLYY